MSKKIDLSKSVYELVKAYPELADIMAGLGFKEITKKVMLNSVGKLMTIPKGAKMKKIPMANIVMTLMSNGFEIVGEMPSLPKEEMAKELPIRQSQNRKEQLKVYLKRLSEGEDLETVRADFAKNFQDVEPSEIMEAEQELLQEGSPLSEVQRLCDVHSALFHGATREEKIANAEKAVMDSVMAKEEKDSEALRLSSLPGHPLYTFTKENEELAKLLNEFHERKDANLLTRIREISIHYAKKGDLLYPLLKVKYGVTGPSEVMWTVDDEIRDELSELAKTTLHDKQWSLRLESVLKRAEEMIYKEQNILFPICAASFSEKEWFQIYCDSKDYDPCLGVKKEEWKEAENGLHEKTIPIEGEIVMPGGHMKLEELIALLNTIPLEISFIDANNINRFFNEGPKAFKRPGMAIDREVFSCHPPKIEPMVRAIIDDFRNNRRDNVSIWMEKNGRSMFVNYLAVRDKNKKYLGTVELVQDMEFAKEHFKG